MNTKLPRHRAEHRKGPHRPARPFRLARRPHTGGMIRRTAATTNTLRVPERFFGDGPPHWLVGADNRPCETVAEATAAAQREIKRLRKQARISPALDDLAELVEGCSKQARCRSGACHLCRRALQRWFVETAPVTVRRYMTATESDLSAISIITNVRLRGGNDMAHARRQLRSVAESIRRAFDSAGIPFAIGGIDVSLNEDQASRFRPHFQFHVWAIAASADIIKAKRRLEQTFTRSITTCQPARTYPFDGDPAGYAYALKTSFSRRTTLPAGPKADGTWRRQNTRLSPKLPVDRHTRLLAMLHVLGLGGRLVLHGAAVVTNAEGKAVIRPDPE